MDEASGHLAAATDPTLNPNPQPEGWGNYPRKDNPQMIDRTNAPQVYKLAQAIARHLPGWEAKIINREDYDPRIQIVKGDLALEITRGKQYDRLNIYGSHPHEWWKHAPYNQKHVEISVSINRQPADLAKDIARRLIPAYTAQRAEIIERMRAAEDRTTRRDAIAAAIHNNARGTLKEARHTDREHSVIMYGDTLPHIHIYKVEVNSADSVSFDISADGPAAAALTAWLIQYAKKG